MVDVIEKFVHSFDSDIKIVWHDGPIESSILDKTIYLNIDEFLYEYSDEALHKQVLKEQGYILDIELHTFKILHEMGHVMSAYKVSYDDLLLYEAMVKEIAKLKEPRRMRAYHSLRLERDANRIGYSLYMHHYPRVKALNYLIKEAAKCMLSN
jgi:hypothetical protein